MLGSPVITIARCSPVLLLARVRSLVTVPALVAVGLTSGVALLATFMMLGRPPISHPMSAGVMHFTVIAVLLLLLLKGEASALAYGLGLSHDRSRTISLVGAAPLGLAWPLVAALYHPAVNHWFVTVASVKPAMAIAVLAPTLAMKLGISAVLARDAVRAFCWRYRYLVSGAFYTAIGVASKHTLWHGDLPAWFAPAAKLVLAGHPLAIYSVRALEFGRPAPLEHGPLGIFFYAPFIAVAEALGLHDFMRTAAIVPLIGVAATDALLAYVVTRAIRDLAPKLTERSLFGIFTLVLFSPLIWFGSMWMLHLESLMALFLLSGVRHLSRRHAVTAGVLFGVGLLVKHSAALAIGPVLLALALDRQFLLACHAGLVAFAVWVAGLLPFALANLQDFLFNFTGYAGIKPIYGVTIWKASYGSGLEPLLMRYDTLIVALLVLLAAAGLGIVARVQGARASGLLVSTPASAVASWTPLCWAALVLGQMTWLGLATWVYPHYFLLGFVALLVWEVGVQAQLDGTESVSWPLLSLLFLFVPYNLQAHFPRNVGKAGGPWVVTRAAALLVFLYGCFVAVWIKALGDVGDVTNA